MKQNPHQPMLAGSIAICALAAAVVLPTCSAADAQAAAAPASIVDLGLHHRTWQTPYVTQRNGRSTTNFQSYTEMQTGLHRFDPDLNTLVETDPRIELFQDGAVVRHLQYSVIFSPNLNSPGAIDISLPDGQRLTGQIMGLALTEGTNSVLIAEVRDCVGEVSGEQQNILTFKSAFTDFDMDVQFQVQRASLSQVLIFKERIPDPTQYGLTANAHLELLSEWTTAPQVTTQTFVWEEAHDGQNALIDQRIDLGSMTFLTGHAFSTDGGVTHDSVPIAHRWEQIENRSFVVEKVPWLKISDEFQKLPPPQAGFKKRDDKGFLMAKTGRPIPPQKTQKAKTIKPIRISKLAALPKRGLSWDWDLAVSSGSVVWASDKTYYISGVVVVTTNVFQGGCVLKYAPTNSAQLKITGPVTCLSSNFRPIVCTARDDSSVGAQVGTNALSGYYATYALYLDYFSSGTPFSFHDIRISYADTAVNFYGGSDHVLSHAQLVNCHYAYANYYAFVNLRNVLGEYIGTVCSGPGSTHATSRWEHVTLNQVNHFNDDAGCTFFLTNSLLVAVTNTGSYSGANNASNITPANVFQTVGASAAYLQPGSPYRDAGTTNINAALLSQIRTRTTWPPTMLDSNSFITVSTTWYPTAPRDVDTPDLGFHAAAADYGVDWLVLSNASLTVAPGTVIAVFGQEGIVVADSASLTCSGTALSPVHITPFYAIQELTTNWDGWTIPAVTYKVLGRQYATNTATAVFSFTQFDGMSSGGYSIFSAGAASLGSLTMQHCTANAGFFDLESGSTPTESYLLQNNLFENTLVYGISDVRTLGFYNNLHKGGMLYFDKTGPTNHIWTVRDNAYDNCTVAWDDDPYTTGGFNAFINSTQFLPTNATDIVLSSFTWQSGPLGAYYQSTNSQLINAGSRSGSSASLYHFCTTTNEVTETNSTVDLSFHFVAVDVNGNPLDQDLDTLADYLEDLNNSGAYDAGLGETDWQTYNSRYGIGPGPGLVVFTPLK